MSDAANDVVARFEAARASHSDIAVLAGLHAVKHCIRFGGRPTDFITTDPVALFKLSNELAPDIAQRLMAEVLVLTDAAMAHACPRAPTSPLAALAKRRESNPTDLLNSASDRHVILLEDPRHTGNVGAVIRVAAAADAAGVITIGELDPWNEAVLRGAAGLHYAIGIARCPTIEALPRAARSIVALDPQGEPLDPTAVPNDAVLVFGTERHGISSELLERADQCFQLPMREGVSSLNLATAVAGTLFALQFGRPRSGS